MSAETTIEWTQRTWNPIVGCSLASPGCTNCYAMKMAGRLEAMGVPYYQGTTQKTKNGFVWTGKIGFNENAMLEPLRRRTPTTWFVNSMSDLFHPDVPDDVIDQVFAVMAMCPQHIFQVLTKRSDRMREYLTHHLTGFRIRSEMQKIQPVAVLEMSWPLPNVWAGVSVEDQKRAEERIPDLLATPAAVRWLSCEPLLGPVKIRSALRPRQPIRLADMPLAWKDFDWPSWVPANTRQHIENFWRESYGRGPRAWLRDAISQGGPALWTESTIRRSTQAGEPVSGRFVHLWNNIACVVQPDGNAEHGSFAGSGIFTAVIENERGLDWVVAGGESGPGARPMHPDWERSLRLQCLAAGVPYFGKQWGDWAPAPEILDARGASFHRFKDGTWMQRVGKKIAGRLFDGVQHDGMPTS